MVIVVVVVADDAVAIFVMNSRESRRRLDFVDRLIVAVVAADEEDCDCSRFLILNLVLTVDCLTCLAWTRMMKTTTTMRTMMMMTRTTTTTMNINRFDYY